MRAKWKNFELVGKIFERQQILNFLPLKS